MGVRAEENCKAEGVEARWGEARRGVRHAEDKFLEPLQGIWSYACRSDRAGREEREGNTSSEGEKEDMNRQFERSSGGTEGEDKQEI